MEIFIFQIFGDLITPYRAGGRPIERGARSIRRTLYRAVVPDCSLVQSRLDGLPT